MPLLGFTKLKDKLLDGSKTQTIRKPRKHPLKVGDKLFIYWKLRTKSCEKLGEAVITKIMRTVFWHLTEEDAAKDGFANRKEMREALWKMHPKTVLGTELDVISFRWTQKLWEKQKHE